MAGRPFMLPLATSRPYAQIAVASIRCEIAPSHHVKLRVSPMHGPTRNSATPRVEPGDQVAATEAVIGGHEQPTYNMDYPGPESTRGLRRVPATHPA